MSAARRLSAALLTVFAAFLLAVELIDALWLAFSGKIDIAHAGTVLGLTAAVFLILAAASVVGRRS
jgi:hypothetical protein